MSYNKTILLGHVGRDPEIKNFDNGGKVASFSIATTERGYTAKNGTQVPERTDWHNIIVWGGLAKVVEGYVTKGTQLLIEGKIRNRSYDDRDGNKRYVTEIYADNLRLLGGARQSDSPPAPVETSVEPQPDEDLPF